MPDQGEGRAAVRALTIRLTLAQLVLVRDILDSMCICKQASIRRYEVTFTTAVDLREFELKLSAVDVRTTRAYVTREAIWRKVTGALEAAA